MKIQLKSKSKTVFIVTINNEIWGILPAKILRFFSLHPDNDNNLPETEQEKILQEMEKYSWDRFLNFLAYRERSLWECTTFLKQLPLHIDLIEKLIQKAKESNFVNDDRFSDLYIQDLIAKNRSNMQVKTKLIEKHISNNIIEKKLSEHFTKQQSEQVLEANFQKAFNRFHSLPAEKRKEKILNYLTRKGFSYSNVKEKLDEEV